MTARKRTAGFVPTAAIFMKGKNRPSSVRSATMTRDILQGRSFHPGSSRLRTVSKHALAHIPPRNLILQSRVQMI